MNEKILTRRIERYYDFVLLKAPKIILDLEISGIEEALDDLNVKNADKELLLTFLINFTKDTA